MNTFMLRHRIGIVPNSVYDGLPKMKRFSIGNLSTAFEIGGSDRSLPMKGLRGVAVGLVFFQHYCKQFETYSRVSGFTRETSAVFSEIGNFGVELFFVLSGYLIYGILLRKRPLFVRFMARRAQRLCPAFLVALTIGALANIVRTAPKFPAGVDNAIIYLLETLSSFPDCSRSNPSSPSIGA